MAQFGRKSAGSGRSSRGIPALRERMETIPTSRGWGWGRVTLAVIGGLFVLGVIGQMAEADKAAAPAKSAAVTAAPKPCVATLKKYSALRTGMSQREATSIVGCAGSELSRVSYGGQESVMVSWDGGFLANMNATFDNDRLVAKAQLGLK